MNWTMVGALGEMAGAFAVVLSLMYLAQQVGMSNRLGRAEAWRASSDNLNTLNAGFGSDPVFRRSLHRALYEKADRDALEPEERVVLGMYVGSLLNVYAQLHREVHEGIVPAEAIDGFAGARLFMTPFFRSSWPLLRQDQDQAFARYLESKLALGVG